MNLGKPIGNRVNALNEVREAKAVYIIGPNNRLPAIQQIFKNKKDCLIIGDCKNFLSEKEIREALEDKKLKIGPNTRIDIHGHGDRIYGENEKDKKKKPKTHTVNLFKKMGSTKDVFKIIGKIAQGPVHINLFSCFGAAANKNIKDLPKGSTLITHVESDYEAWAPAMNRHMESLKHYSNNTALTSEQQFLYSIRYGGSPMTFSKITENDEIKQHKTTRFLKTNNIKDLSEKLKDDSYKNILENNKQKEEDKFFKKFQEELGGKYKATLPLTKEEIEIGITGILMHALDNLKQESDINLIRNDIIPKLSEQGFDLDHKSLIRSLNEFFINQKNLDVVELLLSSGADPCNINNNIFKDLISETKKQNRFDIFNNSVTQACMQGNNDTVSLLLRNGVNANLSDEKGSTLLHHAAAEGHNEVVKTLLSKGARPNIRNKSGETPLDYAATKGHDNVVKTLVAAGAALDSQNKLNKTPLNYAVKRGQINTSKASSRSDTSGQIQNNNRQPPLNNNAMEINNQNLKTIISQENLKPMQGTIKNKQDEGNTKSILPSVSSLRNRFERGR